MLFIIDVGGGGIPLPTSLRSEPPLLFQSRGCQKRKAVCLFDIPFESLQTDIQKHAVKDTFLYVAGAYWIRLEL